MSDIDNKALALLTEPTTCTELGEELWGGVRKRQCYARPAGKIIKRLVEAKLVERVFPEGWRNRPTLYQRLPKKH